LPHAPFSALLLAASLAACAGRGGTATCQPRRMEVSNIAARPVEQFYYGAPGRWGEDLLRGVEMAPGTTRSVVLPGIAGYTLRAVWTDGRAIEMRGFEACRNTRIVMAEGGIRAD
jgi:hypothetical protein